MNTTYISVSFTDTQSSRNNYEADMLPHSITGEITRQELSDALKRDDVIVVPHDTYRLDAGCDFLSIDENLFTPLIEIYSRGDSAEYFGNPYNNRGQQCEGGYYQDALKRGAKMGVIAASDDHLCKNGLIDKDYESRGKDLTFPGITGVLAKENTLEAIFDALKKRRCYGFMGEGRVYIDFRINSHYMGEEFVHDGDREIYYKIESETPIKRVTLVKNSRDYMIFTRNEQFIFDYKIESPSDYYYLRIELTDGRLAWCSPIWITN